MDDDDDGSNGRPLFDIKAKRKLAATVNLKVKDIVVSGNRTTLIDQHNFLYKRNKVSNGVVYWQCKGKSCSVTGLSNEKEPASINVRVIHSHLSNACKAEAVILQHKVVEQARENPTVRPRNLFSDLVSTPGVNII